jgi:hypothetical protein
MRDVFSGISGRGLPEKRGQVLAGSQEARKPRKDLDLEGGKGGMERRD